VYRPIYFKMNEENSHETGVAIVFYFHQRSR
jgi:hypothetical protein